MKEIGDDENNTEIMGFREMKWNLVLSYFASFNNYF